MLDEYNDEIFKYPAVQYIPLSKYNEKSGTISGLFNKTQFTIYDYNEENELNNKITRLGLTKNYNMKNNQLAVLVLNGEVDIIRYRGYEVTMVGYKRPGHFQLFKVTTEYFYKDWLSFIFYNNENAQRLDREIYDKPGGFR